VLAFVAKEIIKSSNVTSVGAFAFYTALGFKIFI
jgi:hypothetical protein